MSDLSGFGAYEMLWWVCPPSAGIDSYREGKASRLGYGLSGQQKEPAAFLASCSRSRVLVPVSSSFPKCAV